VGDPRPGSLIYAFYNGGVQIFDVRDPKAPKVAAYFAYGKETPDYACGNQTHGVYVEWHRNIIRAFTNHGIYALPAETLVGQPNLGAPKEPYISQIPRTGVSRLSS
jgi:hypothetical protein